MDPSGVLDSRPGGRPPDFSPFRGVIVKPSTAVLGTPVEQNESALADATCFRNGLSEPRVEAGIRLSPSGAKRTAPFNGTTRFLSTDSLVPSLRDSVLFLPADPQATFPPPLPPNLPTDRTAT